MTFRIPTRFSPRLIRFGLPIVILTVVMLIAARSSDESAGTPPFTPVPQLSTEASLGEAITLSPGQSAEIVGENVELAFHRVSNDSRCPAGAQCITAGTAIVTMQLVGQGFDSGRIEMLISPGGSAELVIGAHTLHLLTLEPGAPADAGDYQITFNVSKN